MPDAGWGYGWGGRIKKEQAPRNGPTERTRKGRVKRGKSARR